MTTVELVEPKPNDIDASVKMLRDRIFPAYARWWSQHIARDGAHAFNPPIQHFINMWFSGSMKIFMASEPGAVTGMLIGMVYRPMQYEASVFGIMDFFADNSDAERALFDHVLQAVRILGCNEIWFDKRYSRDDPELPPEWKKYFTVPTLVYRKD